jgi:putative spermidine/putrescine transport system substrate-binding protein
MNRISRALGAAALLLAPSLAHAEVPVVSIVDTLSGPNFQAFWNTYLIPTIEQKAGVKVKYTLGTGPTLQLQMQSWKPGSPGFTLLFVKGLDLSNFVTVGLPLDRLAPDHMAQIPNIAMEPKGFLEANNGVQLNGTGLVFWRAQFDLVYNSQFVKTPPKTWQEFYDRRAEFAGHIGIVRPDAASGGGRAFIYSFLQAFGVDFSKPFAELEKSPQWTDAWAKFTEFSKAFAQPIASSPPVMFHQFQTEQVWLTDYAQDYSLWSADQGQLPPTTKAAPLDVNIVGASNAWLVVPATATAEQKTAAYKVINVMLSPEVQNTMLARMYEYPGTEAWKTADPAIWNKIPRVDAAQSHGTRISNFAAITYIQQHGQEHFAQ